MHLAGTGKRWMDRELLFAAFDYPFNQLELNVVLGLVDSSNEDAINLNTKLGFRTAHRIVDGHPDGDLILFEMRREDCKWLRGKR
jgi:RimJ/RimL family protein N-acetyltransferase